MLAAGMKLGPYEILGPLGAGGMGEVYRARDTRLGRDVAVKVLPEHLAKAPELRQRFEREARAVSSLNHPHICTLHDVGHQDGVDYLVMELVEGETLAARLEKGPLPTEALLKTAIEMADALDKAHRSGIVHRDLKPGNIMLTRSGAKLMDFGLARETGLAGGPVGAALSQTPTVSQPLTAEGTIVGTFQYMAPEQIEGAEADARTDLFAFGTVLYEMATGRKAFAGRSQASLLAAILKEEPKPITDVQPMAPPALDRVVRRCLAKDPDDRWQSARDVVHELQWIRDAGSQAGLPAPIAARRKSRERLLWGAIGLVIGAGLVLLAWSWLGAGRSPAHPARLTVPLPHGNRLGSPAATCISPDGSALAFVAADSSGTGRIWIRPLDETAARVLAGTENADMPFWSPDSRHLGFFADGKLKRIPAAGGPVQTLRDANSPRGGAWSHGGVILFAPLGEGPLFRVSPNGGKATQVTTLDSSRHELGHRWPSFLPDGRHFLYATLPHRQGDFDIFVGSLAGDRRKTVLTAHSCPVYAPSGHLIYMRGQTILAHRFDPRSLKLIGEPISIGESGATANNMAETFATVSGNGILAYHQAPKPATDLVWYDREGRPSGKVTSPVGSYLLYSTAFSPDGQRVAVTRTGAGANADLWVLDIARSIATRLTSEPGFEAWPAWSPSGDQLFFSGNPDGPYQLFRSAADRPGTAEPVFSSGVLLKSVNDCSRDWTTLVFAQDMPKTNYDIWAMPLVGGGEPVACIHSVFNELGAVLSPDGHWVAYTSDETGRFEVYLQTFPGPGTRRQVSATGGNTVAWRADGRELFLSTNEGRLMAVEVAMTPGVGFRWGRRARSSACRRGTKAGRRRPMGGASWWPSLRRINLHRSSPWCWTGRR